MLHAELTDTHTHVFPKCCESTDMLPTPRWCYKHREFFCPCGLGSAASIQADPAILFAHIAAHTMFLAKIQPNMIVQVHCMCQFKIDAAFHLLIFLRIALSQHFLFQDPEQALSQHFLFKGPGQALSQRFLISGESGRTVAALPSFTPPQKRCRSISFGDYMEWKHYRSESIHYACF